ncbi:MAG: hypothetical protein P4L98_01945 [Ancalomicrobiaceae bacterium]|nr:hypothetical protein [Ancalomicrobiaceae bacterium]
MPIDTRLPGLGVDNFAGYEFQDDLEADGQRPELTASPGRQMPAIGATV